MNPRPRHSHLWRVGWVCLLSAALLGVLTLSVRADPSALLPQRAEPPIKSASAAGEPPPRIHLRDLVLDPRIVTPSAAPGTVTKAGLRLWLVQFPGPIQDIWYEAMARSELRVVAYIPDFTYLVWGDYEAIAHLRMEAPVRWWGSYRPEFALHPALRAATRSRPADIDPLTVTVQAVVHPEVVSALEAEGQPREPSTPATLGSGTQTWRVRVTVSEVREIASLPGVINVEPVLVPRLHDERQAQIMIGYLDAGGFAPLGPGYLHWLTATAGMTTAASAYPIVDVTDDGLDDGDAIPSHPDFYRFGDPLAADRLAYNVNWTGDPLADSKGGHGTLNAAIVAGYNARTGSAYEDAAGYNYGLGITPWGRVAGSKVFNNSGSWDGPTYADLIAQSYQNGARVSSNSWGEGVGQGQYRVDDQTYDALVRDADPDTPGNQPMIIVFSAGNSGPGSQTIGSPGNAKNVITVGAAESTRPDWVDGCLIGPSGADNANDIASFSSRGPTADGRVKPDLVAPGTHVIAAASQTAGYTGGNICDRYYPPGQTLYAASSGTSHAAPAVAGAASLLVRRYETWTGQPPSPAMVKAILLNAARYLDGAGSGDTLPSDSQGYGEVNVADALNDTERIFMDQREIMRTTGETYVLQAHVSRAGDPLRVTLAWTDAPGSTVGDAYVNDLDLTIAVSGTTYLGNVFDGAYATTGGAHDRANNVESIIIAPGARGPLTVTVRAYNLAGDGVPGNADPTDQDFALVCTNCVPEPAFDLEVRPRHVDLCTSQTATYTMTPRARGVFSDAVFLQATGYPTGTIAAFTSNPVPVGTSSSLTLKTETGADGGLYPIRVTGTGASITRAVTVTLDLYTAQPVTPSLQAPPDGAYDLDRRPMLVWTPAAGAVAYRVEVGTQPTLDTLTYSATVETASHTLPVPLAYQTRYYWRIVALNPCGKGVPPPVRHFTTVSAPLRVCLDVGRPVPDLASITSTLVLSDTLPVLDLDVALTATHSWVGDLVITLTHQATGAEVVLFDRPSFPGSPIGCQGRDLDIIFDDEADAAVEDSCQDVGHAYPPGGAFRPNSPLRAVEGYGLDGRWTLKVTDGMTGDEGTLDRWCLIPTRISSDAAPDVAFARTDYRTSWQVGTVPISVTLSQPGAQTVTVRYATRDGSARADVHYLTSTGTLTFAPGLTARSFDVPVLSSTLRSVIRTLTLGLSTPRYAVLTAPLTATLDLLPHKPAQILYLPLIFERAPDE